MGSVCAPVLFTSGLIDPLVAGADVKVVFAKVETFKDVYTKT